MGWALCEKTSDTGVSLIGYERIRYFLRVKSEDILSKNDKHYLKTSGEIEQNYYWEVTLEDLTGPFRARVEKESFFNTITPIHVDFANQTVEVKRDSFLEKPYYQLVVKSCNANKEDVVVFGSYSKESCDSFADNLKSIIADWIAQAINAKV